MRSLVGRESIRSRWVDRIGWLVIGLTASAGLWAEGPEEVLPPGVEQLLPRGQIAAIDHPTFVSADKAKIADDAWVLGVVVSGQPKAYSLNLLNRHEVVNDQEGDVAFAAVW